MEYVNVGRTGLRVSRVGLGTMAYGIPGWRPWVLGEEDSRALIRQAVEAGINLFDTADAYSGGVSEEILGRALRDFASRDEVVIATKVFSPMGSGPNRQGLSRKHVLQSIDASLRRLGTDYIDLYQIHRWDDATPIEETLEALEDIVRAGKALHVGASNLRAWQLSKALYNADLRGFSPLVSIQMHYNLIYREEEREMAPLVEDRGVGFFSWSPLARGFLAGTRTRDGAGDSVRAREDKRAREMYFSDSDFDVLDAVTNIARERACAPAQIALAWQLHKPFVTSPIIGAGRSGHLTDAVKAAELRLESEEMELLERSYRTRPPVGYTDENLTAEASSGGSQP